MEVGDADELFLAFLLEGHGDTEIFYEVVKLFGC